MRLNGAAVAAVVVVSVTLTTVAVAQSAEEFYRNKQLRLIIGNPAGGDYDLGGRTLARFMTKHIPGDPTIVVQNMPGASTIVAANHLYNVAPKDGTVFGSFSPCRWPTAMRRASCLPNAGRITTRDPISTMRSR